ncbi:DUF6356 family protein [Sphingomonas sp. LY29]|uniref:DUF6356 family protein n=1 Tax=Sphingomonas sp. LY29 TaxID=3095341 RepID=UPI002D76BA80|nr:DUF6356 family protein [Sphingomonas sp. LY29]WRP26254.1 DUF6356 family protein [Sphingomonas sp. LY29]
MIRQSKQHLSAAGERYGEHFRFATTVGCLAVAAGIACLLHAVIPALCTGTCSRIIRRLNVLFDERERLSEISDESSDAIAFVVLLGLATIAVVPLWAMAVPTPIRLLYTALAFAIPAALLLSNRELASEPRTVPA